MNDELNRMEAFLLNLILHVMATNGMARIIGCQVMFSACPNHLDFWLEAWFGVQEYKLSTGTLALSWIIELWHGSIYEMGLWLSLGWMGARSEEQGKSHYEFLNATNSSGRWKRESDISFRCRGQKLWGCVQLKRRNNCKTGQACKNKAKNCEQEKAFLYSSLPHEIIKLL